MAAGPVSRILSALRRDGHSSGPGITAGLKRPTRRFGAPSRHASSRSWNFLPIWSCSVWGLPCPPHYCGGGALLPHLFTLTSPIHKIPSRRDTKVCEWAGRYLFCGTFRQPGLNLASRTLSGTLLCGVRTFLYHPRRATATVRSGYQLDHYIRCGTAGFGLSAVGGAKMRLFALHWALGRNRSARLTLRHDKTLKMI